MSLLSVYLCLWFDVIKINLLNGAVHTSYSFYSTVLWVPLYKYSLFIVYNKPQNRNFYFCLSNVCFQIRNCVIYFFDLHLKTISSNTVIFSRKIHIYKSYLKMYKIVAWGWLKAILLVYARGLRLEGSRAAVSSGLGLGWPSSGTFSACHLLIA